MPLDFDLQTHGGNRIRGGRIEREQQLTIGHSSCSIVQIPAFPKDLHVLARFKEGYWVVEMTPDMFTKISFGARPYSLEHLRQLCELIVDPLSQSWKLSLKRRLYILHLPSRARLYLTPLVSGPE